MCKQRIPGNRSGSLRIRRDGKERWVHKNAKAATIARFQTSAMEMYVHAILSRLRWMPIVARESRNETGTTMPTDQASDGYALRTATDLMSDSPVDILASSVPLADDGAIPTYVHGTTRLNIRLWGEVLREIGPCRVVDQAWYVGREAGRRCYWRTVRSLRRDGPA